MEDIIEVRFVTRGSVSLDLERMEDDPVWLETLARTGTDPEARTRAVADYVSAYLRQELVLADMPSTNGPASLYPAEVECRWHDPVREVPPARAGRDRDGKTDREGGR